MRGLGKHKRLSQKLTMSHCEIQWILRKLPTVKFSELSGRYKGRVYTNQDNFTFVSTRDKSVVDICRTIVCECVQVLVYN